MKKLLVFLLAFLILLPSSALGKADEKKAESLKALNLFKGTDKGFELDREAARIEGIVTVIRLLGKENEALKGTDKHKFNDVEKWADKYVAYSYNNKISMGTSETTFDSQGKIDENQFLTLVLRAMGYNDKEGDFSWDKASDFAVKIGLIKEKSTGNFLRANMVDICYNALTCKIKNEESLLFEKLANNNVFSQEDFAKATGYEIKYSPKAEIVKIYGNKKAIFTPTIDDGNLDHGLKMNEACKENGIKATAMISTRIIDNSDAVNQWNKIFAMGYMDLGCHGYTHKSITSLSDEERYYETVTAMKDLQNRFKKMNVITYATPYTGSLASYEKELEGVIYSNRSYGDGLLGVSNPKTSILLNLPAQIIRSNTTAAELNQKMDQALQKGLWYIQLWHGFDKPEDEYYPPYSVIKDHFAYVNAKARDIWCASMTEATMYLVERMYSEVVASGDENEITVSVTNSLDKNKFYHPLTVMINLPKGVYEATVNNKLVNGMDGYIYIDIVPNSGATKVEFNNK